MYGVEQNLPIFVDQDRREVSDTEVVAWVSDIEDLSVQCIFRVLDDPHQGIDPIIEVGEAAFWLPSPTSTMSSFFRRFLMKMDSTEAIAQLSLLEGVQFGPYPIEGPEQGVGEITVVPVGCNDPVEQLFGA